MHLSRLAELPHGLRTLLVEDIANVLAHLICKVLILLDLLLRIPEPLVNLLLLEVEVRGELEYLGALRRASLQLLEEPPERISLDSGLSLPAVLLAALDGA